MNTTLLLVKRNIKLFFKDKGMFFTSLITPLILLVLYATFLGNTYKDGITSALPEGFKIDPNLIDGFVGGQLISSILAVSCITVAFCSNMLMVQDKANGTIKDFKISPVKSSSMALGYYFATFISTMIVCCVAAVICLVYVASAGWYMTLTDILFLFLDILLLVLFGTALSSVINFFLSTQGQISAVGAIISSCYGFICGAYMPISQFGDGIQTVVKFLPGTYGTSLVRNHCLDSVIEAMKDDGVPQGVIDGVSEMTDCNIEFFSYNVSIAQKYVILIASVAILVAIYIILNIFKRKKI